MRRAKRTGRVVLLDARSIRRLEEIATQRRASAGSGIPVEVARLSCLSRLPIEPFAPYEPYEAYEPHRRVWPPHMNPNPSEHR